MSASSVETKHPKYLEISPDWVIIRDCHKGERHVKLKRTTYLPATTAMQQAGMTNTKTEGTEMYNAYITRAVFPDLIKPAVNALVGVMHREPAEIQLPKAMEPLLENATLKGESLQTLLRLINEQQLLTGRVGLLVDVPEETGGLPYISTYHAENIINWDSSRRPDGREKPDLVVLNETKQERKERFEWEDVKQFLVLDLAQRDDPLATVPIPPGLPSVYRSQLVVVDNQQLTTRAGLNRQTEVVSVDTPEDAVVPKFGNTALPEIPFVFIGSIDLTEDPDQVPLLGLANLSMTIYRGEADYRQTLFMQGQDTLVVSGDTTQTEGEEGKERVIGAFAYLNLSVGATAEFIGVSSEGLAEQRSALENDRGRGSELGANLLASAKSGAGKEAAASLKIRVAARTASLLTIIKSASEGLQTALRIMAVWMGEKPEEVVVTPNLDFVEDEFPGKELIDLMTARSLGAPLSLQSIHAIMKAKDITVLEFEEELKLIEAEEPIIPPDRSDDPVDDDEETKRLESEENDPDDTE